MLLVNIFMSHYKEAERDTAPRLSFKLAQLIGEV